MGAAVDPKTGLPAGFTLDALPAGFTLDPPGAKTPFQKQAASRKLGIEVEQNAATMEQDIADARTTAAKQLSAAIPVAASLFTGGMTLPAAMGLMGTSGATAGAIGQGVALGTGSTQAPKSGMELAKDLGVDALWGTLGEGVGRSIVPAMKFMSSKVLTPMIARSASKSDTGVALLDSHALNITNKLRDIYEKTGKPRVDVDGELKAFFDGLAKRKTGNSDAFKGLMDEIVPKMDIASGGNLSQQPLAHLIEIQELISPAAWKRAGLNHEERTLLRNLSDGLRQKLADTYGQIGGKEGRALFEELKFTRRQIDDIKDAHKLAENFSRALMWRLGFHALGAGGGAYAGAQSGGAKGAALGALGGAVASTAVTAIPRRVAPFLLEKIYADPKASVFAGKALGQLQVGNVKEAEALFTKAAWQSGLLDGPKDWIKDLVNEAAATEEQ